MSVLIEKFGYLEQHDVLLYFWVIIILLMSLGNTLSKVC